MKNIKWIGLISLLTCTLAQAASFDCTKARKTVEKLICANETLSKLDDLLAEAYSDASLAPEAPPDLQQRQRRWLAKRASCQTVKCLEAAYEDRIIELQSQAECLVELKTYSCTKSPVQIGKLPRTADGRLMLLTENECHRRAGAADGLATRSQAEAIQVQADCFEAGFGVVCDDAGERLGDAQCAPARLEVEERRIRKAQNRFREMFRGSSTENAFQKALEGSQKNWMSDRESICKEMNRRYVTLREQVDKDWQVDELPPEKREGAEKMGNCFVGLTYERASKLEEWVLTLQESHGSAERTKAFLDFLSNSARR